MSLFGSFIGSKGIYRPTFGGASTMTFPGPAAPKAPSSSSNPLWSLMSRGMQPKLPPSMLPPGAGAPVTPPMSDTGPRPPVVENPRLPGSGSTNDMWGAWNKVPGGDLMGLSYEAMNQMIKSGMFNPGGSQSMIDALRGQAVGDASALRKRSNVLGSLSGMDPAQAASSYFQRDMGSQGEVQRMLLNARLQSMSQNRTALEGLANTGATNRWAEWLDAMMKNRAQNPEYVKP